MRWIRDELLPHCGRFPGPKSVIIMDNASFHCHPEVATAIEEAGCEVRYLPSYSPDFNPIELSFSVLKAWVRRHFDSIWPTFDVTFGSFLAYGIQRSHCDRFAWQHFKHTAGGGIVIEADIIALEEQLRSNELEIDVDS